MVPAAFVLLAEIPLTPNGKVDRKQLAKFDLGAAVTAESFVAPRNETEAAIAQIWAEVLDLERVGVYSNFFEIGGHSLRATRVISRIHKTFGIELPLRSLFEFSTVAALSEKIDAARGAARSAAAANQRGYRASRISFRFHSRNSVCGSYINYNSTTRLTTCRWPCG